MLVLAGESLPRLIHRMQSYKKLLTFASSVRNKFAICMFSLKICILFLQK